MPHHPSAPANHAGPGPAAVIAYLMFTVYGAILGLLLGWLIWA